MASYERRSTVVVDDDPPAQTIILSKHPGDAASCRVVLGPLDHSGTLVSLLPLAADRTALAGLLTKIRTAALLALGATVKP